MVFFRNTITYRIKQQKENMDLYDDELNSKFIAQDDIAPLIALEKEMYLAGDARSEVIREFLDLLWMNEMTVLFEEPKMTYAYKVCYGEGDKPKRKKKVKA